MSAVKTAWALGGEMDRGDDRGGGEGRGGQENLATRPSSRANALRAVLVKLLDNRFGLLSPAVSGRIDTAGIAELERWLDRGYEAKRLDDVFGG